jgi:hypothetical protein
MIFEFKKRYLLAEYARTSFKLAQAYGISGEWEKRAHFKQTAIEALRSVLEADTGDTGVDYDVEKSYDRAVCVLRR